MELFRIFKNKKFIAAVITLLLLNCVSFYITQQKSLSDFGINIDTYSATFKDNADIFTEVDKKSIIEKSNKFEILKSFADNTEDKAQQIKEYPDLYQEYKNNDTYVQRCKKESKEEKRKIKRKQIKNSKKNWRNRKW